MNDAIDAADVAFWAEIAKAYPAVRYGDMDPEAVHAWREGCRAAVQSWLEANLPPLERLHDDLLDLGYAPTWGDEDGTSLWVSLVWPAECFNRRIEVYDGKDETFSLLLVEDGKDHNGRGSCRYCDKDATCGAERREVSLASVAYEDAADVIYSFTHITHTSFEYETGRA